MGLQGMNGLKFQFKCMMKGSCFVFLEVIHRSTYIVVPLIILVVLAFGGKISKFPWALCSLIQVFWIFEAVVWVMCGGSDLFGVEFCWLFVLFCLCVVFCCVKFEICLCWWVACCRSFRWCVPCRYCACAVGSVSVVFEWRGSRLGRVWWIWFEWYWNLLIVCVSVLFYLPCVVFCCVNVEFCLRGCVACCRSFWWCVPCRYCACASGSVSVVFVLRGGRLGRVWWIWFDWYWNVLIICVSVLFYLPFVVFCCVNVEFCLCGCVPCRFCACASGVNLYIRCKVVCSRGCGWGIPSLSGFEV